MPAVRGLRRRPVGRRRRPVVRALRRAPPRWSRAHPRRGDGALARFAELTGGHLTPASPPVHRAVRANAAIANVRAFEAAGAARDPDAFVNLIADEATMVEHPTGGAECDRSQILGIWRSFLGR